MAKNDQDRRSLEEQLASLDAMSKEQDAPHEAADAPAPADASPGNDGQTADGVADPAAGQIADQADGRTDGQGDARADDYPGNPWPASPPPFPAQLGYEPPPLPARPEPGGPQPQDFSEPPPLDPLPDTPAPGTAYREEVLADFPPAENPPPPTGPPVEGPPPPPAYAPAAPPQGPAAAHLQPPPAPDGVMPPPPQGPPVTDVPPPPGAVQPPAPAGQPPAPAAPSAPGASAPPPAQPTGEAPGGYALVPPPGGQPALPAAPDQPGVYAPGTPMGQPGTNAPVSYGAPVQAPASGTAHQHPPQPPTSDSLSAENLLRPRRKAPAGGWRKMIYKATGGAIHPGMSPAERRRQELIKRACTPVARGHHRVAVMSLKGGVGKTTTTVGLGATLASLRGDRVIAVDANPDRGTLSDKVRLETDATVRDLLNERDQIQRYADVRAFTSQAPSRLEVLASDRDPAVSEAFSAEDYRAVAEVLEQFYSICITDCGTGLLHSAMAGVLSLADQLVLVSSPSVDGARSASATLDWLDAHGHGDLVRSGVVVLSMVRARSKSSVDLDKLQEHFESRCRAVVRVPYDDHLEEGAEVDLDQLSPACQDAYLQLAAIVADGFAWPR